MEQTSMKSWKQNSNIFIQENGFESVVCETAVILSRPQYIKTMVVGLPYIATALLLSYVLPNNIIYYVYRTMPGIKLPPLAK